jgi:hypothetical protein
MMIPERDRNMLDSFTGTVIYVVYPKIIVIVHLLVERFVWLSNEYVPAGPAVSNLHSFTNPSHNTPSEAQYPPVSHCTVQMSKNLNYSKV